MKTRRAFLALVAALPVLAACGGKAATPETPWPSVEARTMRPGQAPTPFTADQIREACPVGRRATFRVEMPGRAPFLQTFHFTAADADGTEITFHLTDLEGRSLGEPTTSKSAWRGLQAHAAWPAVDTTITEGEETVPAGTFRGFLYRVVTQEGDDQPPLVTEAFFARALPGPPIRMVRTRGEETEMTMTLVANDPGGPRR